MTYFNIFSRTGTLVILFLGITAISFAQKDAAIFVQKGHNGQIGNVEFTEDEQFLFSSEKESIIIWNATTAKEIRRFSIEGSAFDISSDGSMLVTLCEGEKSAFCISDVHNGEMLQRIKADRKYTYGFKFSPDNRKIISAGSDKEIKIWDISTGKLLISNQTSDFPRKGAFYSKGGQYISSQGIVWDASTGTKLFEVDEPFTAYNLTPDGKYLLTGHKDGKIKYWDLKSGNVIRVFSGHYDYISKIEVSSDNSFLLSYSYGDKRVRLWNLNSGRLITSLGGDSSNPKNHFYRVRDMRFSPGSRYFITAGGFNNTIKKWDASSGAFLDSYTSSTSGVTSFELSSEDKNILASTRSGNIHIWDLKSGQMLQHIDTRGIHVETIKYTSDSRFAISSNRNNTFAIWDLEKAELVRQFQSGVYSSASPKFAISPDRKKMLVYGSGRMKLVDVANGDLINSNFHQNRNLTSLYDIKFLNNRQAYTAGLTSIKLWDVYTGRLIKEFNNAGTTTTFAISSDKKKLVSNGQDEMIKVWDMSTETISQNINSNNRFGLENLVFVPGGRYVVASDDKLSIWDTVTGKKVHEFESSNLNYSHIEITQNGRYIVSGDAKGFSVWGLEKKQKKVDLVSNNDEWLAITPEGYFDASDEGADLLNVRIGNSVYSMDNFFETYYRPDIVRLALSGRDTSQLTETDIREGVKLPPEVRFTSPSSGTKAKQKNITLSAEITDQGGGIDEVRLFHNGKLIEGGTRGLKAKFSGSTMKREFEVSLLPGQNNFELIALSSGQRIESNPVRLTVRYDGAKATSDLFVLAVGLNEYKNGALNLNYGRPDAEAFSKSVKQQAQGIFKTVNVTVLHDGEATRASVKQAFENIISKAGPEDAFLFFYAGHGVMSESVDGQPADFYMALYETVQLYGNNEGLATHGISAAEMRELTRRVPARKQMIVLDACQSGGAVQTFAMRGTAEQKAIMQLARSAGLVVMASTGTQQYATEFEALGHGVFTYALLNGLQGKADGGSQDGKITVKELEAFINDRVPALTEKHRGQSQYPNSYARGQDFPIGVIK